MIHVFGVQPFIATLAAMFLARGLCYLISNRSISIEDPFFVAMAQTPVPLRRDPDHLAQRDPGAWSSC